MKYSAHHHYEVRLNMNTRPAKLGVGKETPESPHDTHKSYLASKIQQKASFANLLVTPQVLMKNCSFRQRYYKISPLTYEPNTQRPFRYIFTPPIKGGGEGRGAPDLLVG